jgi:hypothetical protein
MKIDEAAATAAAEVILKFQKQIREVFPKYISL